jgi:hypothetical protein
MSYDDQYYFIHRPSFDEKVPQLRADATTSMLDYAFEVVPIATPLVFTNAWKERNIAKGVSERVTEILFEGADLVVGDRIRNKLLHLEVPNLHMYPSIYIDDRDKWHEDYWYLTFTQRFDCWDRKSSEYDDDPIEGAGMKLYHIDKFRLDKNLLDRTPLKDRLLFKMGGAMLAFITVHESLLPLFRGGGNSGAEFQKITDF